MNRRASGPIAKANRLVVGRCSWLGRSRKSRPSPGPFFWKDLFIEITAVVIGPVEAVGKSTDPLLRPGTGVWISCW